MTDNRSIPEAAVVDRPNAARIYDYYLGGFHNFEIDRLAAERVMQVYPDVRLVTVVNRAFLRRALRFLCEQGIEQFLDIGSGIPTVGNVHEVAQAANPAAKVVYVDIDPIAVAHSQAMLRDDPHAIAIQADAGQPEGILDHPEVRQLLDFDRPVAVLLTAMLHLLPDDAQAYRAVRVLHDAVTPGSYLTITHPTLEDAPSRLLEQMNQLTAESRSNYQYRPYDKIERFFDGLELVEPGLVHTPLWRPEGPDDTWLDEPQRALLLAGVGRKP